MGVLKISKNAISSASAKSNANEVRRPISAA